jgi:hypothetical protein
MCRLPLLPEKELLSNDLEIFDKREEFLTGLIHRRYGRKHMYG